jgi:outer membrane receptor protein involved in Fe transport
MPSYITRSGFIATPAIDGLGEYTNVAGQQNLGTQGWTILRYPQERYDLLGGIDHMRGRHELKFGGEGRMNRVSFTQPGSPAGTFSFNDYTTSEYPWSGGGDGMASFLTGTATEGWGQYEVPGTTIMQNFQYAGYFQDNWKTTDKLTLNAGIRYELELPRTERHNRQEWFDPNLVSPLQVPGLPNLKGGLAATVLCGSRKRSGARSRHHRNRSAGTAERSCAGNQHCRTLTFQGDLAGQIP